MKGLSVEELLKQKEQIAARITELSLVDSRLHYSWANGIDCVELNRLARMASHRKLECQLLRRRLKKLESLIQEGQER